MTAVLRSLLVAAAMLVIYAVVPVTGDLPSWQASLLFVVGLTALVGVTLTMVRRARHDPNGTSIRLEAVAALAYAAVTFFSLTYVALAERGQFVDLANRVDALYFTMATLATVGYGDVHPSGSVARAVVTAQIFLDITLLAVAARVIGGALSNQRSAGGGSPAPGEVAGPPGADAGSS